MKALAFSVVVGLYTLQNDADDVMFTSSLGLSASSSTTAAVLQSLPVAADPGGDMIPDKPLITDQRLQQIPNAQQRSQ